MPVAPTAVALAVAVLVSLFTAVAPAGAAEPDELLLVGVRHGMPGAEVRALHAEAGGARAHRLAALGIDVVRVPAGSVDRALGVYRRGGASFAEINGTVRTFAAPDDPYFAGTGSADLYGLHNTGAFAGIADEDIDAPEGWELLGLAGAGPWPRSGYSIGVVDTGVDTAHPDLAGRISECVEARAGTGAVSPGCHDAEGHGTHVAGTIAAIGNNGTGIVGVAPDADIAMCAALDGTGAGTTADLVGCIDHLVSRATALSLRVINLSLGTDTTSSAMEAAVARATAAGILVVAAAGNGGDTVRNYPASYPDAVSVGALDRTGRHADFSNHNGAVDLAAPGVEIVSTVPGGYAQADGTSMASPHVAAVAGLVAHHQGLRGTDLRARLESTAEDKGAPGRDSAYGHGRVNLCRALLATTCGTSTPPLPPADGPILDPGFEYGPDNPHWSEHTNGPYEVISNDSPHDGVFSADLCGYDNCFTELTHEFVVPAGVVHAELSYALGGVTDESVCSDYLAVGVADSAGNAISWNHHCGINRSTGGPGPLQTRDIAGALQAHEGQTMRVFLLAETRAAKPSRWWVDRIELDVTTTTSTPPTVPSAPPITQVLPGDGQAKVGWGAPASNGGSAITGYKVRVWRDGIEQGIRDVTDPTQRSLVVAPLENGRSYTFQVAAVNSVGQGPWSAASQPVVPKAPSPSQPPPSQPPPSQPPSPPPAPARSGYWMASAAGHVWAFGDAQHHGDAAGRSSARLVDLEPSPGGAGYWMVSANGDVFSYGSASFHGSAGGTPLQPGEQVASMSATPTGRGYWLFTNRGRVFAFGDAPFLGDMAGVALNGPVLGSVGTPTGRGYYMVASDGGIFAFGDARFAGSMGGHRLNKPVQGLVPDADGSGYWLVASDGGVFAFDAPFRGSMGGTRLNQPINGMVRFGNGYLMVASDGGIFNFSDKPFYGSLGGQQLPSPVVTVAAFGT